MSFQLKGLLAILLLAGIGVLIVWAPWETGDGTGVPEDIFAEYDGHWQGTFWSYDIDGRWRESYRQQMQFKTITADSLVGRVARFSLAGDTLAVDSVFNIRRGDTLYCIRIRDNGQREVDRGFWADGQIFWRSRDMFGRMNHGYRERIRDDIWEIDGFTRTDKGRHLMQYGRALKK